MPDAHLISLPQILDDRGNLSFLENDVQIPFAIKRVYWIYDVPGGEAWGGNAFHSSNEVIIALSGSFDVMVNNGQASNKFSLNRSYTALYIPSKTWKTLQNFSTNSLAIVVSDTSYSPGQYIRDWNEYLKIIHE